MLYCVMFVKNLVYRGYGAVCNYVHVGVVSGGSNVPWMCAGM
jgi:hypothetical protein